MGLFGGTITIAIVPPNNPTITWAVTLDPGHHSFSKWAILREKIGEGGFGVVYKVTDEDTAADFALKDVLCEAYNGTHEVHALQQLRHENVINFIAACIKRDSENQLRLLILTEYCAGGNLNKRLTRPSSDFVNFKWMKQCASAFTCNFY